ncbi:uncharacterized protein I303_100512 [Kwoniella dejecticola CBS 10117]|uniref:Uncharacterized protein n=1 Tax=Kwoniella dejecticola CBS 10117 TaxID=1296121 RepID=A0A1A6AF46_9TREE|nr:uncharacterized protein I303_00512 [Kwoniella dejecticola CBS 10117]OBR88695.1 hypothetical protein I303_00512 [Kwoniella dejecticola CBS 10117]
MSLTNVTLDDSSPLITYIGNWDGELHKGDPLVREYSNATFHASNTTGDSATFSWSGGQIWLFGAFRANHGYLSVKLDGDDKQYVNGQADKDVFDQVIFASGDIEIGDHQVVLLNEAGYETSDPKLSWVDLDYIVVQADPAQFDASRIPSGSRMMTTGTPRVQAVMPPTGMPRPITISSGTGGPDSDCGVLRTSTLLLVLLLYYLT